MTRACCLMLVGLNAMAQSPESLEPLESPAPRPGKGAIEGTVINGATREPVKKAQVTLGGPLPSAPMAVTDASGRFAFRQLPAGPYWINAVKSGYNARHSAIGMDSNIQLALGEGEEKQGVEIALMPGGAISGRVVNEDGFAVRNCNITAAQYGYEEGRRILRGVSGGATNDKGDYRLYDIPAGRYYLFAHCQAQLAAAHPLLPRGDPRTPHDTYAPQFYGGGLDPAAATGLSLAAGANLENVDFQVRRTAGFTLRGTLTSSDPDALAGTAAITLLPANRLLRNLWQLGASVDQQAHTFQFHSLIPGSYLLAASATSDDRTFYAQRTIEIGNAPPVPIELSLSGGMDLKGSIQADSQDHPPMEDAQIWLAPMEQSPGAYLPQSQAQIGKDNSFTLTGVMPGRFRVMTGVPGYVKSVSLGGQSVSPYGFEIGAGATGPLRVLIGSKMAEVSVTVTGAPADSTIYVMTFPDDPERLGASLEHISSSPGNSQIPVGSMPPGAYRLLATDLPNPWPLLQRPDLLQALQSRAQTVEVPDDGRVNVPIEIVSRDEILAAIEDKE